MIEAALYILTGLTLYGGVQHLYIGLSRDTTQPHFRSGALYLLLAAFAFSTALAHRSPGLEILLPAGRHAISLGIILWISLVWHMAFRSGYKPLLVLDVLTAAWVIFLLSTHLSPWWSALELTKLASLLFCFYACYQLYRRGRPGAALSNVIGLSLLGLIVWVDHFVSTNPAQAGALTPFGFLLFLLPGSLYAWLQDRREKPTDTAAPLYQPTDTPAQASFHTDVAQLHTPMQKQPAETSANNAASPQADLQAAESEPPDNTIEAGENPRITTALDTTILHTISENLIDIGVYATMALNRLGRGDTDPQALASLCKKVRGQAIKTRRLADQLVRPEQHNDKNSDTKVRSPDTGSGRLATPVDQ